MKSFLVYDNVIGGHHGYYIKHLLDFVSTSSEKNITLFICVPVEFKLVFDLATYEKCTNIQFILKDFAALRKNGDFGRREELEMIESIAREVEADEIILMVLDIFFQEIAKKYLFKISRPKIRGIYFSAIPRRFNTNLGRLDNFNKYSRFNRSAFFWLMLAGRRLNRIFVLSDKWCVDQLNRKLLLKSNYAFIPEPIVQYTLESLRSKDIREKYGLPQKSKILLITGILAERKNIKNILASIVNIPDEQKLYILIVGPVQGSEKSIFPQTLKQLIEDFTKKTENKIPVLFDERELDDQELNSYIYQSDIIAIPYLDYFNASAILFQAILHRKVPLVSNYGFPGYVANKYKLAIAANPEDTNQIAKGIKILLSTYKPDELAWSRFIEDMKPFPETFAKTLLS